MIKTEKESNYEAKFTEMEETIRQMKELIQMQ